jgi:hypothetical protein
VRHALDTFVLLLACGLALKLTNDLWDWAESYYWRRWWRRFLGKDD